MIRVAGRLAAAEEALRAVHASRRQGEIRRFIL
jgi:hypothetical protein